MKKILALILAASLMLCAAYALAATGNVTIAVKGQDGFNDFISGMLVWGDKLLLSSFDTLYAWNSETRKLVEVQGYDQLQYMLTDEETGVIKAEEDEYCYFDSDLYVADGKIYRMALKSFEGAYDVKTVHTWLRTFYRRFFAQQFKRSCLPDGPKVGSVTLSPRGDWRMPSDACNTLWMAELEKLEV